MKKVSTILTYTLLSAGIFYGGFTVTTPIQASAEMTSKQLSEKKAKIDRKIKKLNAEIKAANNALERKVKEFKHLQNDIEEVKSSIHTTEERMDIRADLIDERMGAYQEQESMISPYLEAVLGAESLSDLLSRAMSVKTIIDADQTLLDDQAKDKEVLEKKQEKLEQQKTELQRQFQIMQDEEQKLEVKKVENKAKSLKLKAQIATKKEKEKLERQRKVEEKEAAKLKALAEKEFIKKQALLKEEQKAQEEQAAAEIDETVQPGSAVGESGNAGNGTNGGKISDSNQDVSTVVGDDQANAIIAEAKKYLGTAYVWGGSTPSSGFDCSGLTQWSFKKAGITIPRTAAQQYIAAEKITKVEAKAGDLVFFSYGSGVAHVGIYLGDGRMLDAQNNGVVVESLNWWNQYLVGYGRFN